MSRFERAAIAAVVALAGLAGAGHYAHWASLPTFAIATLALAGLAWIVSFSTESVGEHIGPAATGLLQATLGNLPELFVVLFALRAGERVVAQSAIVGSLFATALLVLGFVLLVGAAAARDGVMRFNAKVPRDAATLLLVCVFIIVIVGLSLSAGDKASHHVNVISAIAAGLLLTVYLAWVIPYVLADSARTGAPVNAKLRLAQALGAAGRRRHRRRVRVRLVRRRARPGDPPAAHLAGLRRARDRRDRQQRRRARRRGRARRPPPGRPRDRGRRELGRADRRVPLPGARPDLADDATPR